MLSISSVANSTKAGHYFNNDNYYAKDSPEAKELSGWWGKTAESLGLSGQIDREQFVDLLNGKMPNGEHLWISVDSIIGFGNYPIKDFGNIRSSSFSQKYYLLS